MLSSWLYIASFHPELNVSSKWMGGGGYVVCSLFYPHCLEQHQDPLCVLIKSMLV